MINSNPSLIPPSPVSSASPRGKHALAVAIATFGFLGFADAGYLAAEHYIPLPLPCSLTQGCDVVLHSAYATVFGLPVALFGALYYLAVFIIAIHYLLDGMTKRKLISLIAYLTGAGLVFSAFLIYLQGFVIRQWCLYCLGSATITTILFILSLLLLRAPSELAEL